MGCNRISDAGLLALAAQCKQLQRLNICNLYDVTDEALVQVATKCRRIDVSPASSRSLLYVCVLFWRKR